MEQRDGRPMVLCLARRKWVVLTPEEWVRQHLVAHLHFDLAYPLALMKMERSVRGSERQQRADVSIHDRQGRALMLVECKAASEPLNNTTVFQAGRYNRHLAAPFILMSNGLDIFCLRIIDGSMNFLDRIPLHSELSAD